MDHQGKYLTPFQHKFLLKSLKTDLRPEYQRRIAIMLLADQGKSQSQICEELGCSQETARHWMTMAQTGQAHLWNGRPMGRPKVINEEYLNRLQALVSHSPRDYGYPFQRWTGQWLSKHLENELGIKVSACHVNRLLRAKGLSVRSDSSSEVSDGNIAEENSLNINDLSIAKDKTLDVMPLHLLGELQK